MGRTYRKLGCLFSILSYWPALALAATTTWRYESVTQNLGGLPVVPAGGVDPSTYFLELCRVDTLTKIEGEPE